jgi:hypothetical protein
VLHTLQVIWYKGQRGEIANMGFDQERHNASTVSAICMAGDRRPHGVGGGRARAGGGPDEAHGDDDLGTAF